LIRYSWIFTVQLHVHLNKELSYRRGTARCIVSVEICQLPRNSAWSGSREQFLHCGIRKFRHSKSSVGLYRWYTQLDRRRFVYDTYKTMKATRMCHGWVHMFITHRPTLALQLHNFDLFRTCRRRTSSFCTVAWQLARFQLTRRIARSLGDSWAFCRDIAGYLSYIADFDPPHLHLAPP